MSTSPSQNAIAIRIYNVLAGGDGNNDGVPSLLAKFMVDQSAHETDGWTSDFFINNNNCFGYSCDPNSQYQDGCSTALADNGVTVGNYKTVEDSAREALDWIWRRVSDGKFPSDLDTITTSDQYAILLKNAGYYGASESVYSSGLSKWADQLSSFFHRL